MGLLYLVRSAMIISEFGNLVIKMKLKNKLLDQLHKEALYDPVDLKKDGVKIFTNVSEILQNILLSLHEIIPSSRTH